MIIDPWGRVLGSCADEIGFASAIPDLQSLRDIRAQMPLKRS